jgi:protein SCO1/2
VAPAPGPDAVPPGPSGHARGQTPLSEAEREAAFTTGRAPVDRTAALQAGSTPIPRRFFVWVAVGFAVLGIGGLIGEKVIGTGGISALTSVPTTTLAGTGGSFPTAPATPDTPTPPDAPPVDATPTAVTGLIHLTARAAPPLDLQDQGGSAWDLARARGKVVVLTFFNAECNDICPVLADEITQADQLLGTRRSGVEFVVVNSDPLETSLAPSPPALTQTHLDGIPNVVFLNGPLTALGTVWKHYGVTVEVNPTVRLASHTEAMFFIDRRGQLRMEATPFANESSLGLYSLDPSTTHSFAEGMADSAGQLARRTS